MPSLSLFGLFLTDALHFSFNQKLFIQEIVESVCARDRRDTQRTVAPLRQAEDCIYIDTTNINLEQVEQKVLEIIEKNDR